MLEQARERMAKDCFCEFGGGKGCERCGGAKRYCEIAQAAKRKIMLRRFARSMVVFSGPSGGELHRMPA